MPEKPVKSKGLSGFVKEKEIQRFLPAISAYSRSRKNEKKVVLSGQL